MKKFHVRLEAEPSDGFEGVLTGGPYEAENVAQVFEQVQGQLERSYPIFTQGDWLSKIEAIEIILWEKWEETQS